MVKVKNKKRINADSISSKKEVLRKKVLNPFEVHINKEKIKVLGRKLKNDRGLPGISRAKALAKRKDTLLPEYQMQNKSNKFTDRRIGEKDKALTTEDKSMARYTAVRVKQHNKKNIFNLADDEVLTHRGQTLSEIEKFDDPKSEEEDEEDSGKLDSKFVRDVHFGGGMLKKADGTKSHKDLIEQLIVESKKRKAEMQKQKEATVELTEKLDTDWKDLLPLVNKKQKSDVVDTKAHVDDYDKVMRELKFEARGTPSDKLKTEDEIAREDKEKLEKLERERLERMRGVIDEPKNSKHRSADDLDDNFAYDDDELEDVTLSYNQEGKSNVLLDIKINNIDEDAPGGSNNEDNEADEGEEAEEEESEVETDDDLSDLKASDSESEEEHSEEEVEKEVGGEDVEENDEEEEEETKPTQIQLTKNAKPSNADTSIPDSDPKILIGILKHPIKETIEDKPPKNPAEIIEDLFRRKEIMEKARNELPYTFKLPDSYEKLQKTLYKKSPEHQGVIIERMIKCNHPSLKEGNKDALGMLFVYLLQYLNDECAEIEDADSLKNMFKVFANLTPFLYDLAQLNPENAATSLIEVVKEKQNEFRGKKTYPDVEVLVYLKLVSCLFSTSDFKHHVVNPCVLFMEQMLLRSRIRTKRDVAYGLFLVCLVLEYTSLSKRFLAATISFLNGVIHMAIPKNTVKLIKVVPPFKSQSSLLVMTAEPLTSTEMPKMAITDLLKTEESIEIDDDFKHATLHVTISLLKKFYSQLLDQPSCYEIFAPSYEYLKQLPLTYCNQMLSTEVRNFISSIEEFKGSRTLEYCRMEKEKPKALRLYEPNIVKVYDARRHKVQSKEKAELDKLMYKLKKEKKGAMREIRRDRAFLGRVKLDKKMKGDAERKEKVKRIYAEASMQQSELNALDRGNKRKKK